MSCEFKISIWNKCVKDWASWNLQFFVTNKYLCALPQDCKSFLWNIAHCFSVNNCYSCLIYPDWKSDFSDKNDNFSTTSMFTHIAILLRLVTRFQSCILLEYQKHSINDTSLMKIKNFTIWINLTHCKLRG